MIRRDFLKSAAGLFCTTPFLLPSHSMALGSGLIDSAESFYKPETLGSDAQQFEPSSQPNNLIVYNDWRQQLLAGHRDVVLYRSGLSEKGQFTYLNSDGSFNEKGYLAACQLLRDVRAGQAAYMSPDLLDTLCVMQRWLRHHGHRGDIYVNSGYRTAKTNSGLEGAKKNSYHLKGMAADITIPGIPTKVITNMAIMLEKGGVGFYASKNFVHIDTGRLRHWRG